MAKFNELFKINLILSSGRQGIAMIYKGLLSSLSESFDSLIPTHRLPMMIFTAIFSLSLFHDQDTVAELRLSLLLYLYKIIHIFLIGHLIESCPLLVQLGSMGCIDYTVWDPARSSVLFMILLDTHKFCPLVIYPIIIIHSLLTLLECGFNFIFGYFVSYLYYACFDYISSYRRSLTIILIVIIFIRECAKGGYGVFSRNSILRVPVFCVIIDYFGYSSASLLSCAAVMLFLTFGKHMIRFL